MDDFENKIVIVEHTVKDQHERIANLRKDHSELLKTVHDLDSKVSGVKGDVRSYAIQHGESIKTLQEAVQALRELTAELKQESKLQEKSIQAVISQMQSMNDSIMNMSKTVNKFLYIGSGVIITLSLISSGTLTNILSTVGG